MPTNLDPLYTKVPDSKGLLGVWDDIITEAPLALMALAAFSRYLGKVKTVSATPLQAGVSALSHVLKDIQTYLYTVWQVSSPVPPQSVRPLSVDKLPPSLWPNSMTTMSPDTTVLMIVSNRPSLVKLRADRPPIALLTTGIDNESARYCPHPRTGVRSR